MEIKKLLTKSIEKLGKHLRNREISPVEIVEVYLDRIFTIDVKINAYITVLEQEALQRAKECEREISAGNYRGPLHGIPLAVKDNINIKDVRTTNGSIIDRQFIAQEDATVMKRLFQQGMILLGKTNLHEYAFGVTTDNPHYGKTRNPWNLEHIAGGSSGGSAAALAANMTPTAIGTDTGGSIRIPSACCGTVGLKPTYNKLSTKGVFPLAWSFDHIGPMARTVRDVAYIYSGMENGDINLSVNEYLDRDFGGLKVAFLENVYPLDQSVTEGLQKIAQYFQLSNVYYDNITIPELQHVTYISNVITCAEAATIHNKHLIEYPFKYGEDVGTVLKLGQSITAVDYIQAQQQRQIIFDKIEEVLNRYDLIVAPIIPSSAPRFDDSYIEIEGEQLDFLDAFTLLPSIANLTGHPALSIPSNLSTDKLPVAIQIIGRKHEEWKLLKVGHYLEQFQPLENGMHSFHI